MLHLGNRSNRHTALARVCRNRSVAMSRASLPVVAAILACAGSGAAAASLYWDKNGSTAGLGGTGNWLGGSTWNTDSTGGSGGAVSAWSNSNDAFFGGTLGTVTVNGNVTASSLNFIASGNQYILATGGAGTSITLNTGSTTAPAINIGASGTTSVTVSLSAASTVSITAGSNNPILNLVGVNTFSGGLEVKDKMRLNFNVDGAAGNGGNANAAIQVDTTATILSNQNNVSTALTINIPQKVVLNPNSTVGFQVAMGATTGTGGGGGPILNWQGAISGAADVIIANGVGGGGAAPTQFSSAGNTYTGRTIIDNTDSFATLRMGVNNALPTGTDVVFGNNDVRQIGMLDLNNHNIEIGSLATGYASGGHALGVGNSGGTVATLKISGTGTDNNATGGPADYSTLTFAYNSIIGASSTTGGAGGTVGNNNEAVDYESTATWQLGGVNTYTGGTTIGIGTVQLVGSGSLSSAGSLTMTGGTFDIGAFSQQVTGLSGTGGTIKSTSATSTFTANITTAANTFGGVITSGIAFTKTGTGKLGLTGANTYTGNTTVAAGALAVDSPGSLGNTTVTVATNATLGGNGSIAGAVAVASGATLSPGDPVGTLTINNNLTLNPNAALKFDLGTSSDSVSVTGSTLTIPAAGASINPVPIDITNSGGLAPGLYPLIVYTGSLSGDFGHLILRSLPSGFAYSLKNDPNSIDLRVLALGTAKTWTGTTSPTWDTVAANWTPSMYNDADPVTFDDTGANTSITIGSQVDPGPIVFNNTAAVPYTIGGAPIGGTTTLTLNGSGTVRLTGNNTFSGTVTINAGTLSVASDANLGNIFNSMVMGTSTTTGTLQATASFTSNRLFTFNGTAGFDVTGSNNLTLTGILGGTGGLTKSNTGTLTLSNTANSYQGATNISVGTLATGVAESIPDSSAVSIAAGATLNLGANNETVGSINGDGNIIVGATLTSGGSNASTAFSGPISGTGTITKTGSGTLTLGGSNTFGGSKVVNINAGTLAISSNGNLGAATNTVAIADSATLAIDTAAAAFSSNRGVAIAAGSNGATVSVTGGNGATLSGSITGGGNALNKAGAGTLTLSNAANSFTGLNITAGTVATAADAPLGAGGVIFTNGGGLQTTSSFSTTRTFTVGFGGGVVDTGSNSLTMNSLFVGPQNTGITKLGTGTLVLAQGGLGGGPGAVVYQGGWFIQAGTVVVNNVDANGIGGVGTGGTTAGQLVTNSVRPSNGGTFQIDGVTLGSQISTARSPRIYLDNGGTLLGTSEAGNNAAYGYDGGGLFIFRSTNPASPVVANISTRVATDLLTIQNEILQSNKPADPSNFSGPGNATINVTGPGQVILKGGDLSGLSNYAGSWNIQNGIVELGPVTANPNAGMSTNPRPYGEPLTALGFVDGDPDRANPVTISGAGVLAVGADALNTNPAWQALPQGTGHATNFLRNAVTLSGGAIASTGFEVSYDADPVQPQGIPTSVPVTAQFGGDFTVAAGTSSVLTYDPADPAHPARSVQLVGGAGFDTLTATALTYATNWVGTLTINPGSSTGGSFDILRDAGTISVTPGASIHVLQGATLNLGGSADSLTDGTNFVNVQNDSTTTFNVTSGTHQIGVLSGVGNTNVAAGATLSAVSITQNAVTVAGTAKVRAVNGPLNNATVSNIATLNFTGAGTLDLGDNELLTHATQSVIKSDIGAGTIFTSSTGGALGYADQGGGVTEVRFTLLGDTNLDGTVDVTDLGNLASNYGVTAGDFWSQGDFDYNGSVDVSDLGDLAGNFGLSLPAGPLAIPAVMAGAGAAVPEPTSLGLLGIGVVGLLSRRRRAR